MLNEYVLELASLFVLHTLIKLCKLYLPYPYGFGATLICLLKIFPSHSWETLYVIYGWNCYWMRDYKTLCDILIIRTYNHLALKITNTQEPKQTTRQHQHSCSSVGPSTTRQPNLPPPNKTRVNLRPLREEQKSPPPTSAWERKYTGHLNWSSTNPDRRILNNSTKRWWFICCRNYNTT